MANFWLQGKTLDRMHHMAHFALGAGNDLFDHREVMVSSLVGLSHKTDVADADRVILCRVAELLDVVLSRNHDDLFLPMECMITCHVPVRCDALWTVVLRDAGAAAQQCHQVARLLRAYCRHLPRYLLLREHNWLERCVFLLLDTEQRLGGVK